MLSHSGQLPQLIFTRCFRWAQQAADRSLEVLPLGGACWSLARSPRLRTVKSCAPGPKIRKWHCQGGTRGFSGSKSRIQGHSPVWPFGRVHATWRRRREGRFCLRSVREGFTERVTPGFRYEGRVGFVMGVRRAGAPWGGASGLRARVAVSARTGGGGQLHPAPWVRFWTGSEKPLWTVNTAGNHVALTACHLPRPCNAVNPVKPACAILCTSIPNAQCAVGTCP